MNRLGARDTPYATEDIARAGALAFDTLPESRPACESSGMPGPWPVIDLEVGCIRTRLLRALAALAAVAIVPACSSKASAISTNDLDVTEVPCVVARGAPLFETGQPSTVEIRGPEACKRAIEVFLDGHADDRIASVIPVAHDAEPGNGQRSTTAGTQRLIVLHTSQDGPWPRGRELGVGSITCSELADRESGNPDARDGGRSCGGALRDYSDFPPIAVWVPITRDADTDAVLVLYRGEPHRRP